MQWDEHLRQLSDKIAWRDVGLVSALVLIAFSIRMIGIDQSSLWLDEGFSLWFSRQSFADLLGPIARNEYNPTLYYVLLKFWTGVFGDSVTALRSLSAVINTLTLPFVYLTARWAIVGKQGRLIAIVSAVLFALAFEEMHFAQEASTYSLSVLAIAVAAAASVRIIHLNLAVSPDAERIALWPFVLLAVGLGIALWSHYTTLIPVVIIGGFHAGLLICRWRVHPVLLQRYGITLAVFLLLAGRSIWVFIAYALPASDEFWIGVPSVFDLIDSASLIFGGALLLESWNLDILLRLIIFGPWPLIGAFVAWRQGDVAARTVVMFLLIISIGTYCAFVAVTMFGKPVLMQRVVLPVQVGWIELCAMSVLLFTDQNRRWLMSGVLVGVFALSAGRYLADIPRAAPKEPWREAAALIARTASPNETVHVTATGDTLIAYYLQREGRSDLVVRSVNGPMRLPDPRPAFSIDAIKYSAALTPSMMEAFVEELSKGEPGWMVLRAPNTAIPQDVRRVSAPFEGERVILQPGPLGVYRINSTSHIALEDPEGTR